MADEIELHYVDAQAPDAVMVAWRSDPPRPLRDGGFEVIDESYNSLTWETRFYDWPAKLMIVASCGFLLLLKGIIPMHSVWRVTTRFDRDPEAPDRTRVTVQGKASERTRTALSETAAEHGGSVGLRVGA